MRFTFYISFIILFIKTITQKKSEKTFKNLFNNDFTFKLIHFVEETFENLFNNDFIFKFIYFNETIIFDIKNSIFQKKKTTLIYIHIKIFYFFILLIDNLKIQIIFYIFFIF